MSAIPLEKLDVITQDELAEVKRLDSLLREWREQIKDRLIDGAVVEDGALIARLEERRKAIPVKKYREWLVEATSEGSVSRREKLIKRGSYEALVIR